MTIESVRLLPYALRLRDPWPAVPTPLAERSGCLLVLTDADGRIGLGDAAPYPGFGIETLGSSAAALRTAAHRLVGLPDEAWLEAAANLEHLAQVAATPAARCAIDQALHDLAAQTVGGSIAGLLGGELALAAVAANATIPRVPPERTATLAREAIAAGAGTIKVKVGGAPLAEDLARVRAAREAVGEEVAIRIDANEAWTEEEARAALAALHVYEIEYVEQPVAAHDVAALARLRAAGLVPVAADVTDAPSARHVLDAEAVDLLVLKPMVLGGLHATRTVAALAAERGIPVVITSMIESAVGRTGALHLAASLGPAPHAHGIATGTALLEDVADAPRFERGTVRVPRGPGLGIALDPERLRSAAPVVAA